MNDSAKGGVEPGAAYRIIALVFDTTSSLSTVGSRQLELASEDLDGLTILRDALQPAAQTDLETPR